MQQLPSNYRQTDWAHQDLRPKLTLRRLQEEPIDAVNRIAGDIGPRRATSLAEAQAAAYLDGRLRRAGMRVSPDTFSSPASVGWDGVLLGVFALISTALYYWLPLPSLLLALWNLALVCWRLTRPRQPLLAPRRDSQNIIGTRAVNRNPRWRVVMLAPLDSPLIKGRFLRWLTDEWRPLIGRVVACGLLAVFGAIGMLDAGMMAGWWYAQFVPLAYLLVLGVADVLLMRAAASPGAT
ncbi:MAG: hypothetical protein HC828_18710 [Blastochloris sp.]|nr:hypothetical protein [Blastochloris sp.]